MAVFHNYFFPLTRRYRSYSCSFCNVVSVLKKKLVKMAKFLVNFGVTAHVEAPSKTDTLQQ